MKVSVKFLLSFHGLILITSSSIDPFLQQYGLFDPFSQQIGMLPLSQAVAKVTEMFGCDEIIRCEFFSDLPEIKGSSSIDLALSVH